MDDTEAMDARLPVSVLLLARDERAALESLLPSLAFAAEVVVVWDPRGDAAARAAAERSGARVHERVFDGFGPQRRFALAQCREPWVLWIDADERLEPGSEAAIRQSLDACAAGGPSAFHLWRRTRFLGRTIRFCGWQRERVLRLFRREQWDFDDALVHERLVPRAGTVAAVGETDVTLEHDSYATWEACVGKMNAYAEAGAQAAHRAGRRAGALDVAWRPPLRFFRQYLLQLGLLDGVHGLVLCALAATQVLLKYARLWELGRRMRASP
jgi:hypothetical protein